MSDMEDVIGKFNDILKEKNIDLHQVLGDEEKSNPLDFNFDLDTIIKFKNIFGQINNTNSERNRLLYSLKPFLHEERRKKLDQYIQMANLLGVLEMLNQSS